jgi:hypothetical protein
MDWFFELSSAVEILGVSTVMGEEVTPIIDRCLAALRERVTDPEDKKELDSIKPIAGVTELYPLCEQINELAKRVECS